MADVINNNNNSINKGDAAASVISDVYGQIHPIETPELIERSLQEFKTVLEERTRLPDHDNVSVREAMEKCPSLLTREFELAFLRCEVFEVDLAVARYMYYWKLRVEIFGREKAFQPLTLSQALSDDTVALEMGFARLLPGIQDPQGRAILYLDPSLQDKTRYNYMSMCRAAWYVLHAALFERPSHSSSSSTEKEGESELSAAAIAAQRYGVVILNDPSRAKFEQFDRRLARQVVTSLQGALPIRLAAIHLCNPPTFFAMILRLIYLFMKERTRKRTIIHPGSTAKVRRALAAYGLDKSKLPTQLGGEVVLDHLQWLQERRSRGL